ncbi:hypothetical protein OESDEN_06692 [Oesophagostomum dentatum]|uniref:Uncharacterized protein n=1 Tax=Oesophagostomum dentatum TaxID=61180 RepID=A0A0B1TC32_OESDE|nr:hypothetical protein OESDEN_06692 [Oesophagostomum dentatum]
MEKIEWVQERLRDDFAANQALRSQFRKEKKELTEKRARDDDLRARCSLSIPLAPEDPNDKKVAGMLARYRTVKTYEERQEERRNEITAKRIFASTSKPSTSSAETSTPSSIERLKNNIKLDRNRRINSNFESGPAPKKSSLSLGIVRKSVKRELDDHELEEDVELHTLNDTDVNDEKDVKDEKKEEDDLAKAGRLVADYDSSGSGSD